MSKQICFILDWYPTKTNNGCVFAKHLIYAIADKGFDCVVIAPRIKNAQKENIPYKRSETTGNGNIIRIFTPTYYHLSSRKQTIKLSMNNHFKAVMRTIKKESIKPDAVYGHFIYQCGLTAARVGEKLGVPSYCACGENSTRFDEGSEPYSTGIKYAGWKEILNKLTGIISVSSHNATLIVKKDFISKEMKIGVFPNGVDRKKFYISDKLKVRKELGFPEDEFIVVFTGTFTERKGIDKLNTALKNCENIYAVFLGSGELKPDCNNILFCGKISNDEVAKYLNAADVFVLPTKGEGCCNAIVEALACGLPVISSDLPFNDDVLDETNSIRVDVNGINQIENAINKLKTDKSLLNGLREGAARSAEKFDINVRAENIIRFMELSE